jgi:transposase
MNGIPEATPIRLTAEERAELEGLARSTKTEYRLRQRARIVLLAADGAASRMIGREVGCTTGTASKWRVRYARDRLAGLDETGDRGAEPKYTGATDSRILAVLDRPVPAGYGRWTGPLIVVELGDVDVQYVWRFLRTHKIDLAARKSWCESNDPAFAAKAAEIVGLIWIRPTARWCWELTRSRRSRRWNGRKATSSCPTGAPSPVSPTTTRAMAPQLCLPPSTSPTARFVPGTTAAAGASSFLTS